MIGPDDCVHAELTLMPDPTLPEPYDGWLGVRIGDHGEVSFMPLVRPDLPAPALGVVADWVLARVARILAPDGSEPDVWYCESDGVRYAFHLPDGLPTDAAASPLHG